MKSPPTLIANYYRKHALLPDDTIDCMEYALQTIYNEVSKFLIYLVFFAILRLTNVYLITYLSFISLRIFAGGIHCKTYWGCFVSSFLMIAGTIACAHYCRNTPVLTYVSLLSVVFPAILSPVTPSFRIIKNKRNFWILKAIAIGFSFTLISIAYFYCDNAVYSNTMLLSVSVTNYQLIIPKWISKSK